MDEEPVAPLDAEDGWHRVGGRRIDFVSTRAELQELLDGALRAEDGPWHLTGTDPVRVERRRWEHRPFRCESTNLTDCDTDAPGHRLNVWAWSESFTSRLPDAPPNKYDALCSLSGFIGIQRSGDWSGGGGEAAFMCVDRLRSITGDERIHAAYRRVFERLRRSVKKRLSGSGMIRTARDGTQYIDLATPWTAAALEAFHDGTSFPSQPAEE